MKKVIIKVDARGRVSLTKLAKELPEAFYAYLEDDKIILEPVIEIISPPLSRFSSEEKKTVDERQKSWSPKSLPKK